MGRKPKKKDIAEYLWHSEPTKINATNDNWRIRYGYLDSEGKEHQTTETVNNERAKNQFVSYLLLREKEHKAAKGTTVASMLISIAFLLPWSLSFNSLISSLAVSVQSTIS